MIMEMLKKLKSNLNLGKIKVDNVELISLMVLLYLNVFKPGILVKISKTFFGKFMLILLLISSLLYSNLLGISIALIIIILTEKHYEGLKNMNKNSKSTSSNNSSSTTSSVSGTSSSSKKKSNNKNSNKKDNMNENMNENDNEKKEFLKKHCKNINGKSVLVDLSGKKLNLNNINNVYKNLEFKSGLCDPCNSTCSFEITHSNEKLSVEEKLKPKSSNK
jgi:ABC-type transport system involved in cytochrome bd biosynthesis fused ATPase/permease subunit